MSQFNVRGGVALTALAAILVLSACDAGPSAVPARKQDSAASTSGAAPESGGQTATSEGRSDPRDAPVREVDGKPMWAANRRATGEEAAQRQFDRNGASFGAKDLDDYVRKAQAFVGKPPAGVETISRRNGDTLMYDAKSNIFAVKSKNGAPKAFFKPDDGAAYWAKAKDREAEFKANGYRRGGDGEGRGGEGRGGEGRGERYGRGGGDRDQG